MNYKTCFIYNNSTGPLTLAMNTSSWVLQNSTGYQLPSNFSSYLSFSWNYSGTAILSHIAIPVLLSLSVSFYTAKIHSFAFNINVFSNTAVPETIGAPFFAVTVALTAFGIGAVYWFYRRIQKVRPVKVG
jgi:hypothetical protein